MYRAVVLAKNQTTFPMVFYLKSELIRRQNLLALLSIQAWEAMAFYQATEESDKTTNTYVNNSMYEVYYYISKV